MPYMDNKYNIKIIIITNKISLTKHKSYIIRISLSVFLIKYIKNQELIHIKCKNFKYINKY